MKIYLFSPNASFQSESVGNPRSVGGFGNAFIIQSSSLITDSNTGKVRRIYEILQFCSAHWQVCHKIALPVTINPKDFFQRTVLVSPTSEVPYGFLLFKETLVQGGNSGVYAGPCYLSFKNGFRFGDIDNHVDVYISALMYHLGVEASWHLAKSQSVPSIPSKCAAFSHFINAFLGKVPLRLVAEILQALLAQPDLAERDVQYLQHLEQATTDVASLQSIAPPAHLKAAHTYFLLFAFDVSWDLSLQELLAFPFLDIETIFDSLCQQPAVWWANYLEPVGHALNVSLQPDTTEGSDVVRSLWLAGRLIIQQKPRYLLPVLRRLAEVAQQQRTYVAQFCSLDRPEEALAARLVLKFWGSAALHQEGDPCDLSLLCRFFFEEHADWLEVTLSTAWLQRHMGPILAIHKIKMLGKSQVSVRDLLLECINQSRQFPEQGKDFFQRIKINRFLQTSDLSQQVWTSLCIINDALAIVRKPDQRGEDEAVIWKALQQLPVPQIVSSYAEYRELADASSHTPLPVDTAMYKLVTRYQYLSRLCTQRGQGDRVPQNEEVCALSALLPKRRAPVYLQENVSRGSLDTTNPRLVRWNDGSTTGDEEEPRSAEQAIACLVSWIQRSSGAALRAPIQWHRVVELLAAMLVDRESTSPLWQALVDCEQLRPALQQAIERLVADVDPARLDPLVLVIQAVLNNPNVQTNLPFSMQIMQALINQNKCEMLTHYEWACCLDNIYHQSEFQDRQQVDAIRTMLQQVMQAIPPQEPNGSQSSLFHHAPALLMLIQERKLLIQYLLLPDCHDDIPINLMTAMVAHDTRQWDAWRAHLYRTLKHEGIDTVFTTVVGGQTPLDFLYRLDGQNGIQPYYYLKTMYNLLTDAGRAHWMQQLTSSPPNVQIVHQITKTGGYDRRLARNSPDGLKAHHANWVTALLPGERRDAFKDVIKQYDVNRRKHRAQAGSASWGEIRGHTKEVPVQSRDQRGAAAAASSTHKQSVRLDPAVALFHPCPDDEQALREAGVLKCNDAAPGQYQKTRRVNKSV